MGNPICPYCGYESELVTGEKVYPHRPDLYNKLFYMCGADNAWVGTHSLTDQPLGRLANAELRRAKSKAHEVFDPLWKSGTMTRGQAYQWLSEQMGIEKKYCHIGMFNVSQCKKVVELVQSRNNNP